MLLTLLLWNKHIPKHKETNQHALKHTYINIFKLKGTLTHWTPNMSGMSDTETEETILTRKHS